MMLHLIKSHCADYFCPQLEITDEQMGYLFPGNYILLQNVICGCLSTHGCV